jgi:hypothetical protein
LRDRAAWGAGRPLLRCGDGVAYFGYWTPLKKLRVFTRWGVRAQRRERDALLGDNGIDGAINPIAEAPIRQP